MLATLFAEPSNTTILLIAKKNRKKVRASRVTSREMMCSTSLIMNPHPRSLGHCGGSTNSFMLERKTVVVAPVNKEASRHRTEARIDA
jgi:hypothetical protein